MLEWLKSKILELIDDFTEPNFPEEFPPFCFECNDGSCEDCEPYEIWKKDEREGEIAFSKTGKDWPI